MKLIRVLLILSALIITHSQVLWASKARYQSLGQDTNGSFYFKDYRNIFLNPATINRLENQVSLEWGEESVSDSPKAEGGVIHKMGEWNLGVHFGRAAEGTSSIVSSQSDISATSFYPAQNSFDITFGKEGGMPWGAGIHYANSKYDRGASANLPDKEGSIIALRGGLIGDRYTSYLAWDITNLSKTENVGGSHDDYKNKLAVDLGASYDLSSTRLASLQLKTRSADFDNGAGQTGTHDKRSFKLDYFDKFFTKEGTSIFCSLGISWSETVVNYAVISGVPKNQKTLVALPVSLGIESEVTSWMTLRSALTQSIVISDFSLIDGGTSDYKENNGANTSISAGMGIKFNSFEVDATFAGADDDSGAINGSKLMANTSMTYRF